MTICQLLLLLFLLTEVGAQLDLSVIVKTGDNARLPCGNLTPNQNGCGKVSWFDSAQLVSNGKVIEAGLGRVTLRDDDCSLIVHNIQSSDVGRYDCYPHGSGEYILVHLSTVQLTEQKVAGDGSVTLSCSVTFDERQLFAKCRSVDGSEVTTVERRRCSVTFPAVFHQRNPNYRQLFFCDITNNLNSDMQRFTFNSLPTGPRPEDVHLTVRAGEEVTLPCKLQLSADQMKDDLSWVYTQTPSSLSRVLDQLSGNMKTTTSGLSLGDGFSLLLSSVTVEDYGQYACSIQEESGVRSAVVYLSVINIDKSVGMGKQDRLTCTVLTYEGCGHEVEWLSQGGGGQRSQDVCSASVTLASALTPSYDSFTCRVNNSNAVLTCSFGATSCEKQGRESTSMWIYVVIAVTFLAAFIVAMAILARMRHKGQRLRSDAQMEVKSTETCPSPETAPDPVEPKDGVCYVSVNYIKKSHQKDRTPKNLVDDEVTYSSVKMSEPSSDVYATVSKPRT